MSNENANENNHPFIISPDPKIQISTAGTGTEYSAVTFTREDGQWKYSHDGGDSTTYSNASPVNLIPNNPDSGIGGIKVIIEDSSGANYTDAEKIKTETEVQTLVNNSASFEFDAVAGEAFDFRMSGGDLITPGVCYYMRAKTMYSGSYLFASRGNPNGQNHDYITGVPYDTSTSPNSDYLWIFLPTTTKDCYYCYVLGGESFAFGSGNGTKLQMTNNSSTNTYQWNSTSGTFTDAGMNPPQCWTQTGSNLPVETQNTITSGNNDSQVWYLVPAELGPNWTGKGILGPSS